MKSILSIFEIGQRGVGRLTFFKRIQPLLLKFKGIIPDFAIKRFINKEMIYIIKCYDIFYNNDRFLPILSDYKIAKGILYMFDLTVFSWSSNPEPLHLSQIFSTVFPVP